MTSAIGRKTRRRRAARAAGTARPLSRGGFTLLEIVLVLGLIAVAGAIVVANAIAMVDRDGKRDPAEQLRAAVREARMLAGRERSEARLWFDRESGALKVAAGQPATADADEAGRGAGDVFAEAAEADRSAGADASFPLGERFTGGGARGTVRFFLIPPAEGLRRAPGPEDAEAQVAAVRFAPDRSASRFVAEIDAGSGTPRRIAFDPFSSLPLSSQ